MADRMACDGGSGGSSLTDRREYLKLLVGASGALAGCFTYRPPPDRTPRSSATDRNALLGDSAAIDGDTALVGATKLREDEDTDVDTELVVVFSRMGGEWSPEATLRPDRPGGGFGESVALAGDVALVAAKEDSRQDPTSTEVNGIPSAPTGEYMGAVYAFSRTPDGWSQETILTANDAGSWDKFGYSVAMDGNTALIGAAVDEDPNGEEGGSAYVFERADDGWTQQVKLAGDKQGARFGENVALDGNTALIGAPTEYTADDTGNDDTADDTGNGAAYVFTLQEKEWTRQAKLFVYADRVAVDDDTAFIGAPYENNMYVFSRTDGEWRKQTELSPDDVDQGGVGRENPGDKFANSVALGSDVALVGAPAQDDGDAPRTGSVYVFTRTETGWQRQTKLTDDGGDSLDEFGTAVGLAGDTALVTAPYDEDTDGKFAGTTHTFVRSNGSWEQQAELTASDAGPFETATNSSQSPPLSPETASPSQNTTTTSLDEQSGERN